LSQGHARCWGEPSLSLGNPQGLEPRGPDRGVAVVGDIPVWVRRFVITVVLVAAAQLLGVFEWAGRLL